MHYIRLLAIVAGCVAIAGCDSPSVGFQSVEPETVEVDGFRFAVRVLGEKAEAIRTNAAAVPGKSAVFPAARSAIEKVSGCAVVDIRGDAAIVLATLDC
jgi:hypothetical protein